MSEMHKLAVCGGPSRDVFLLDIRGRVRVERLNGGRRRSHFTVVMPDGSLRPISIVHPPNAVFRVTDSNRHRIVEHRARGLPVSGIERTVLSDTTQRDRCDFRVRVSPSEYPHIIPESKP